MTTIEEVLSWRPAALSRLGDDLAQRRRILVALQDELDAGSPPPSWLAPSAAGARRAHLSLEHDLADLVAEVSAVLTALDAAGTSLTAARTGLESALAAAARAGFRVDRATGRVTDSVCPADEDAAADRQALCDELVDRIEQALRTAAHADAELAEVLDRGARAALDGGGQGLATAAARGEDAAGRDLLAPPEDGSPHDLDAWWNGLTEDEQLAVVARHPRWVGNADGIPAWARDRANRALVEEYRSELEAERVRLRQALDDNWFGGAFTNDDARLADVEDKLRALDEVERTLALGDRQLLLLDPTGAEQMKAVVAVGDVDTADHVAVFTPGLTSTVQDSLAGYDEDMRILRMRAEDEAARHGDGGSVATVTWIGYEAPQTDQLLSPGRSVAQDDLARAGAVDLARFYIGLDASRADDAHLTALGHSYGSLTTGLALAHRTGVDDAVVFGSPGLGTSDLGDLDVPDGHLFRIEARRDAVADFGAFGVDPSHLDGITGLSAEAETVDGRRYDESLGHSAYLTDDTTSQHNIAVTVAGLPDRMVLDGGKGIGDLLSWPVPGTH